MVEGLIQLVAMNQATEQTLKCFQKRHHPQHEVAGVGLRPKFSSVNLTHPGFTYEPTNKVYTTG